MIIILTNSGAQDNIRQIPAENGKGVFAVNADGRRGFFNSI
jgi:hypothetical protein